MTEKKVRLIMKVNNTNPLSLIELCLACIIKNEIHNFLQSANIKLTSYLSDIFSKTGQSLLMLFVNGELNDYDNVTACIHKHVKASPEEFNVGHEWEVVSEGSISLGPKPRRISIVPKTHE